MICVYAETLVSKRVVLLRLNHFGNGAEGECGAAKGRGQRMLRIGARGQMWMTEAKTRARERA